MCFRLSILLADAAKRHSRQKKWMACVGSDASHPWILKVPELWLAGYLQHRFAPFRNIALGSAQINGYLGDQDTVNDLGHNVGDCEEELTCDSATSCCGKGRDDVGDGVESPEDDEDPADGFHGPRSRFGHPGKRLTDLCPGEEEQYQVKHRADCAPDPQRGQVAGLKELADIAQEGQTISWYGGNLDWCMRLSDIHSQMGLFF